MINLEQNLQTEWKGKDKIRVKALCLFVHDGKVLAGKGGDSIKGEEFYRLLGGTVNFEERSEEAMRREIREELGCEIDNLTLLDVLENIFIFEGQRGHEIIFLFKGSLADRSLYNQNKIHVVEDDYEFDALWVSLEDVISGKVILYPEYDYSKVLQQREL